MGGWKGAYNYKIIRGGGWKGWGVDIMVKRTARLYASMIAIQVGI